MRKLIVMMAVAALILGLLAGCGGNSKDTASQDGKTVLTYWAHSDEDAWNESDEAMIAAFQKENPDIIVEREAFPYDDFEQKVMTSFMSKSGGADIYMMWGGWAVDYASTGVFAPVPDEFIADLKGDCYEPVLGALEFEGKYYGVPLEFNAEWGGLLVNKAYFDEHGIAYPKDWDDMIRIGTENSVSSGEVFDMRGFDFISFDTLPYIWMQMILSSGGAFYDGESFDFATPLAKETLQKLVDYVTVDRMTNIECLTGGEIENHDWLFSGEALMAPRGMWTIGSGINDYELEYGVDFEYIQTPFYGPQKLWAAETGWSLGVNSSSANIDAAWKYVEFCLEPENLLQINIDCGMIPPRKSVAHDPDYVAAVPYAAPILDCLDGASFIGYFNTDTLKEAICNMYVDIVLNGTGVDDAVSELNDELNS
ncbi:MAG: extracellular solute-binding protein [Clostridiales bacterium]|nr:extracellular solute-binding protein [Clostridiales bacterium]